MKRKNILLIVFMLTLFVFQQVQAGESMPSAGKTNEMNVRLTAVTGWTDVVLIKIYPLNLGTGEKSSETPCTWAIYQDGCGQSEPLFTGTVTGDNEQGYSVDCNNKPQDPYSREENGYYYLCIDGDYLPDVLPHEMNIGQIRPPEPDALKALAVAARTFVKYKKYLTWGDENSGNRIINNSREYQVYVPWSRSDEYPDGNYENDIVIAVNSTSGQYLSYNGNVIDAEYSSEIIGASLPGAQGYLISVQEPISSSTCTTQGATGNSWGISQRGAIRWAKGNTCPDGSGAAWPAKWNYKQILVHYYTGIDILNSSGSKEAPDNRWNLISHTFPLDVNRMGNANAGEPRQFDITLQNTSTQTWADNNTKIYYEWTAKGAAATGQWIKFDGFSVPATNKGDPLASVTSLPITMPASGGDYTLHLDLYRNGHWFSQQSPGWPDATIDIHVNGSPATPTYTPTPIATVTPIPPVVCNPTAGNDAFADCVIEFQANGNGSQNSWKNPGMVVGPPNCPGWNFMSLGGGGGYVVVDMGEGEEIIDQWGNDLRVYEVGNDCEGNDQPYQVYVSNNSSGPWVFIDEGQGISDFDLGGQLPQARYVKVIDVTLNNGDAPTLGADIDAIKAWKPRYTCEEDWEHWFDSCEQATSTQTNLPGLVDIPLFYRVRDELLNQTPHGSQLSSLYYQHGPEIGGLLLLDPELNQEGLDLLRDWEPKLQALVDGQGDTVSISQTEVDAIDHFLSELQAIGSSELRTAIQNERANLDLQQLVGQTMARAWEEVGDFNPIVLSSVRASPATSGTNYHNVYFTVTFSESVTGVNINDFVLTTDGVSGAEISKVTSISDSIYKVAVKTGSGIGSIRLDVIDNDSIVDTDGYKLGGAGTDNGNFTTGNTYSVDKSVVSTTVTKLGDPGEDGFCDADCSLREAIAAAAWGDTIHFDTLLSGGTIPLTSPLTLFQNITIDASGLAVPVTISGDTDEDGTGDVRVFNVNYGVTATLNALKISRGYDPGRGGGIYVDGILQVLNSIISNNSADQGGGIYNDGVLKIINSTFSNNTATSYGGGIYNWAELEVVNSAFMGNSATSEGGGILNYEELTVTSSTFVANSASYGGAIRNDYTLAISNSTFSANSAAEEGGGIYNYGDLSIANSTFSNNTALPSAAAVYNHTYSTLNYVNTIIANSSPSKDCVNNGTIGTNTNNLVEDGLCAGSSNNRSGDPRLGSLANNGGPTQTMTLLPGSPAINAGDDTICAAAPVNNLDQRGIVRPQSSHCDIGAFESSLSVEADIDAFIGSTHKGSYLVDDIQKASYADVNTGPVEIVSTNGVPIIASERVIYNVNSINTSFSEMMGLPDSQLDTTYWIPWYNNVELNSQLRFANVSNSTATVHVYIGGVEMAGSPFNLAPDASIKKSFAGVSNGPVKIVSNVNIVAAKRVIYTINGVDVSYSETMAQPNSQLDTAYWLPWYNNVELDTQLHIGNVSSSTATVHVYVSGVEMAGSPFTLAPDSSTRRGFAGINQGMVNIVSDVPIVAAQRVVYTVNGINVSYSETMALPNSQLDTTYWLPWYDNVNLDSQLRFANVSSSIATVHIYVDNVEMTGSPFTLASGASLRKSFAGVNGGRVKIVSNVSIVVAERVVYTVNGGNTSFSEMLAFPNRQLDTVFWMPWYNSAEFDTEIRFGMPHSE